jgi:hypothetical protein
MAPITHSLQYKFLYLQGGTTPLYLHFLALTRSTYSSCSSNGEQPQGYYTEWLFESLPANRLADPTLETGAPNASLPARVTVHKHIYSLHHSCSAAYRGRHVPQLRTRKMRLVTMAYIHPARFTVFLYFGDSEINYAVGINAV